MIKLINFLGSWPSTYYILVSYELMVIINKVVAINIS